MFYIVDFDSLGPDVSNVICAVCLQETDYPVHEQIDLYDDVISPSANNGDAPEDRDYLDNLPAPGGTDGNKGAPPNVVYTYTGKRIALYIGNLTWVRCVYTHTLSLSWSIHRTAVPAFLLYKVKGKTLLCVFTNRSISNEFGVNTQSVSDSSLLGVCTVPMCI